MRDIDRTRFEPDMDQLFESWDAYEGESINGWIQLFVLVNEEKEDPLSWLKYLVPGDGQPYPPVGIL